MTQALQGFQLPSSQRMKAALPSAAAGVILGFTQVIFAASLASLIFSGPLAAYASRGIAIGLVAAGVSVLFSALFASLTGAIASIQDNPAVVMSVMAASIASIIGPGPDLLPTVIAMIMLTTILTGVFLMLVGYFELGGLVRYIPYPVIGGFIAGTGYLLAAGAINTMTDVPLNFDHVGDLLQSSELIRWLPGVVFGLLIAVMTRLSKSPLVVPGMTLAGLVVFYAALLVSGTSIDAAAGRGLLLGQAGSDVSWKPLPLQDLADANWSVVARQAGSIGTVVLLTAVSLLLNISGLELALRRDVNLNHELRTVGMGNLLSGLGGGMIGYHGMSFTIVSHRIGARGRLTGIITGSICLITLIAGTAALKYIPTMLMGGFLMYLGADFLYQWVVRGYQRLDRLDYIVVLMILFIIAVWGFLAGVSIGLIVMTLIFVWSYSRTNIFHHVLSGSEVSSHVLRNAHHRQALIKLRRHIYILELQGFIFFGTANTLLEKIRQRLVEPAEKPMLFLILDFRRVTGLDSSVVFSFNKVKYLADMHDFTLIFTHMTAADQHELTRNGLPVDERVMFFPDMDHALEWCEEKLLERDAVTQKHLPSTLQLQLADMGFKKKYTDQLRAYLDPVRLEKGEYLINQGDEATDMFFIEVGQVSVYLDMGDNKRLRLQTLNMGTVVGELAFYLQTRRSASVVATMKTLAHRLSRDKLDTMKQDNPELALAFNELMLRLISERLVLNNQELAALNR